mgnify:CR=1 FL=1
MEKLFNCNKPIIGMVHLLPLPGSPKFDGDVEKVIQRALEDAKLLKGGGIDGIIVENAGDSPFLIGEDFDSAAIALMSVITKKIVEMTDLVIGVNCSSNAAVASFAVAKASGAKFIRSTAWANGYYATSGFVPAAAPKGSRYRNSIFAQDVKVLADVKVKNGSHWFLNDKSLSELCSDVKSLGADSVIVTGHTSGVMPEISEIKIMKESAGLPLLIGSGATTENVKQLLDLSDGIIIGSYFKRSGKMSEPVDAKRVKLFMDAVNEYKKGRED